MTLPEVSGQNKTTMSGKGITRKTREFLGVVMFQSPPATFRAAEQTSRLTIALMNDTNCPGEEVAPQMLKMILPDAYHGRQ